LKKYDIAMANMAQAGFWRSLLQPSREHMIASTKKKAMLTRRMRKATATRHLLKYISTV
jgi:hypothetical protein